MKIPVIIVGVVFGLLLTSKAVSWAFGLISSPSDFGVFFGIVLLLGVALVWVLAVQKIRKSNIYCADIKKIDGHHLAFLILVVGASLFSTGCTRIEPGHAGIEVDLYGKDRGV